MPQPENGKAKQQTFPLVAAGTSAHVCCVRAHLRRHLHLHQYDTAPDYASFGQMHLVGWAY